MNGKYCKDAVVKAIKLHKFIIEGNEFMVKDITILLGCSWHCAKKWIDAASLCWPISEERLDYKPGRPTIYRLEKP
jgi:hypothetical protein